MTPDERRAMKKRAAMRQPVRLTMGQLAVLREVLLARREAYRAALAPLGTTTTWDAEDRLNDVIGAVVEARCDLKRRKGYSLVGDSECEVYATDAELDAWHEAHPEVAS